MGRVGLGPNPFVRIHCGVVFQFPLINHNMDRLSRTGLSSEIKVAK